VRRAVPIIFAVSGIDEMAQPLVAGLSDLTASMR
jgi:hypothetical protein